MTSHIEAEREAPKTHTCECGFTWEHGKSGSHICGPYYRQRIEELERRLASQPSAASGYRVPEGFVLVPKKETPEWRANLTEIGYSHRTVINDVLAASPYPSDERGNG